MSLSNVGAGNTAGAGPFQQRGLGPGGHFRQLIQAIKSGNLDAAQAAFDGLTSQLPASAQPSASSAAASASGKNSFQQFLRQVGTALQNGNIQAAQEALNNFEEAGKTGHHPHEGDTTPSTSTATSADAAGGGNVNLTV